MNKEDKQVDKNTQSGNGSELAELKEKCTELENDWKRALADYKNLEKRTAEEKISIIEFSNSVLVESLLPILDNFEMLEQHSDDMGLKLSIKEFKQVLQNAGLKEIEVNVSDDFDHETMDAVETESGEENKITEIIRKGYFFKDKIVRPVSVKVGEGKK